MTSRFAQGMESRIRVRQEDRWAIKLYNTTFIEEHHLQILVNWKESSPWTTYAIIINDSTKSMCDSEYRARGEFTGIECLVAMKPKDKYELTVG